tara:strand:- start:250 stop:378 length:129 start_codon:yes stop_codon:yes gene_type:complete
MYEATSACSAALAVFFGTPSCAKIWLVSYWFSRTKSGALMYR